MIITSIELAPPINVFGNPVYNTAADILKELGSGTIYVTFQIRSVVGIVEGILEPDDFNPEHRDVIRNKAKQEIIEFAEKHYYGKK